jgi:glycosyltransferase involved in cell wall biosynthesis
MQHAPLAVLACRASVIQNGIDLAPYVAPPIPEERVRLRRALGLGAEDVAIGSVGLLWRAKGQEHLLRALARLQDVVVFLVGSGADEKPLRDLAVDLGITGRVRFLGWRDDVRQLLQAVDLYVQPSLTEGLPLAVVEAGAAGLPIVASDVGGIPEIITHGANGLLVPPGDPQALAQAIQKLIEDPQMARRLGDAARQAAFERFSAEAMAERYMQLYERLLRDVR